MVTSCYAEASGASEPEIAFAASIAYALGEDAEKFFRDYSPNQNVFRQML